MTYLLDHGGSECISHSGPNLLALNRREIYISLGREAVDCAQVTVAERHDVVLEHCA